MTSTLVSLLLSSALFCCGNAAIAQQSTKPVTPVPQHSEDLSAATQASKDTTPQASPEIQSLTTALSGEWSLSVKWEPDASTPSGLVNIGEKNWRAGLGGYSLPEEEHLRMPKGDVFLLGIGWWNSMTKGLRGMECQNLLPYTCDVKGALNDIAMSWDGKQFVIDEMETSDTGKKSIWHEVWSDITSASFTQTGEYGGPGGYSLVPGPHAVGEDSPTRLFPDSRIVVHGRFSDEIVGKGADIVFIPGLTCSRATWMAEAQRLKVRYRLHLIQVAGFAGEPPRANAFGEVLKPTAEAIDAYLVEQHMTPATVIGHSLGGTMVLYLAETHPADIKKGFIVDALPFYAVVSLGPEATLESARPIADEIRSGKLRRTEAQRAAFMAMMAMAQSDKDLIEVWAKASNQSTVANATADDLTLDMRQGLANITVPLTLIYPDYTPVGNPLGAADELYRGAYAAVPKMKFVEVMKSLHFIIFDQPTQFDAALDAFLAN